MTEDKQLVSPDSSGMVQVIYILYLVSLAFRNYVALAQSITSALLTFCLPKHQY